MHVRSQSAGPRSGLRPLTLILLTAASVMFSAAPSYACEIFLQGQYLHETGDVSSGCYGADNTDPIRAVYTTPSTGVSYTFYDQYGCQGEQVANGTGSQNFPNITVSSLDLSCPVGDGRTNAVPPARTPAS